MELHNLKKLPGAINQNFKWLEHILNGSKHIQCQSVHSQPSDFEETAEDRLLSLMFAFGVKVPIWFWDLLQSADWIGIDW